MPEPKVTEYLVIEEVFPAPERKTKVWEIRSRRHGDTLGVVKWYGAWRQYTFWPAHGTIWNTGCLADVQAFITEQMAARERERKKVVSSDLGV